MRIPPSTDPVRIAFRAPGCAITTQDVRGPRNRHSVAYASLGNQCVSNSVVVPSVSRTVIPGTDQGLPLRWLVPRRPLPQYLAFWRQPRQLMSSSSSPPPAPPQGCSPGDAGQRSSISSIALSAESSSGSGLFTTVKKPLPQSIVVVTRRPSE